MNLTRKILIQFCFMLCNVLCIAQSESQSYTTMYDLHFTMKNDSSVLYPWIENAAYHNYSIPFYVKNSDRNLFAKRYFKGFPYSDRLMTEYQQRILLPSNNLKEADIEFECKGENIKKVSIIFSGIDIEENTLFSDTLKFIPYAELNLVSKKIKLINSMLLDIRVNAEGELGKEAYIAFAKLNITIDGRAIDSFPIRELPRLVQSEDLMYIPMNLEKDIDLDQIKEIKNRQIIGFGESIHGNNDMKNLVYQLILQAVQNQNCKLILFEMPMEKSFAYNRYVQDENYSLDPLLQIDPFLSDLLYKLRIFNADKTNESKIQIYGIDYNSINSDSQNSAIDIFDFVTRLNHHSKIPEIDQFSLLLMEKDWNQAIIFLEAHQKKIQEMLTDNEIEGILHILNVSNINGNNEIQRNINRDSIMFLNAKFLIDKFAKTKNIKTIIYGHALHLNPVSTYPAVPCTPFGYYMQKTYSENYSPFLFLIGNGSTMAYDGNYSRKNLFLSPPPLNSMEYLLNSICENISYIPLTSDFNELLLSRFKGSHHIKQEFYPFNLYQRYKGVFFIKNKYFEIKGEKESSFEENFNLFKSNKEQRQIILDEIKKRTSILQD